LKGAFLTTGNRLELSASIVERTAVRYTPAGVPVISVTLHHQSRQMEAGTERNVDVTVPAIALGDIAGKIQGMLSNQLYRFEGFIAARSLKSQNLLFHITRFSLIE